jgi:hypothetical protein
MRVFGTYIWLLFLIHFCCIAQPPCTITNTINNVNPVCDDNYIGIQNSGIIRINLVAINSSNKHVFSTVGESTGDTFLGLYDSSGNLISSNDDANCGGCKQSTITYGEVLGGGNVSGLYLILARPSCGSINFTTDLKYSARNEYDLDPKISSPMGTVQCLGSEVNFTYSLPPSIIGDNLSNPWSSDDTSIATINSATGRAVFINNGIAKIRLRVKNSCIIVNNYIVKGSLTSTINH